MPPNISDPHRLFLQSFLSRGILNGREVRDLYKFVCERFRVDEDDSKLADFTLKINSNIKPYHMEIKKGIDEHDGTNFYCLVNLKEGDISRMASRYTAVELEYFKKLMEEIVCGSAEGSLSSMDALNLTEDLQGKTLRKREAEALIERLCRERWLAKKEGLILLTPRTLMEFDHYIQEQYPDDSVQCEVCRKLVVKGQNCSQCPVRMHVHCARKFFRPENPECPKCADPWSHDLTKPAKAIKASVEEPQHETQIPKETRRSARR